MYQTITEYDFIEAFDAANRSENFTRAARRELFYWIEDYEADTGESFELDVIALCCEWDEMTLAELHDQYPDIMEGVEGLDEAQEALSEGTVAIVVEDSETILFMAF